MCRSVLHNAYLKKVSMNAIAINPLLIRARATFLIWTWRKPLPGLSPRCVPDSWDLDQLDL